MTAGTDQAQRMAPPPEPVAVDATTDEQRLVMHLRLSRYLRFAREHGGADGDWAPLLEDDETVRLAEALANDLDAVRRGFLDDFTAARPDAMATHLGVLADWIVDWRRRLEADPRLRPQQLAAAVKRLIAEFSESDDLFKRLMDAEAPVAFLRRSDLASGAGRIADLRRLYFSLLSVLSQIEAIAKAEWEPSLRSGDHEPAAALLLAFSLAYDRVQARINRFAGQLRDFYYDDYLKVAARPGHPDSAHLILRRDPMFSGTVAATPGTRFLVPRSDAAPAAEFVAESGLRLTAVEVALVRTLRLQRDAMSAAESKLGLVSRARVDELAPTEGGFSMPLFGADVRGAVRSGGEARLGLAVCSPVLWLKEGERSITIRLGLDVNPGLVRRRGPDGKPADVDPQSLVGLANRLADAKDSEAFLLLLGEFLGRWVLTEDDPLDEAAIEAIVARAKALKLPDEKSEGPTSPADIVLGLLGRNALAPSDGPATRRKLLRNALLENMFTASVSVADGWRTFQRTVIEGGDIGNGSASLALLFHLSNEDPPVTACTAEAHGSEWPTDAPTLRLELNDAAAFYPYSLLRDVVLRSIDLDVQVNGVRDVRAYNQLGPLDASRPFMPFGPLPDAASYLVIAAPELARKRLTGLTILPDWSGLPPEGLDAWYAAYGSGYYDESFAVALSVMRDGVWLEAGATSQQLFNAPSVGRPIVVDPMALRSLWRPTNGDLVLDQNARNGFVRLQLARPAGAFGHRAYPNLLTDSLSAKVRGRRNQPTPNPPYTPALSRVTLNYSATAHIDVGSAALPAKGVASEQVLHLHPFGTQLIHPTGTGAQYRVIPVFEHDGHLFIGLSGAAPTGVQTLLFELDKDAAIGSIARGPRPRIAWSWLGADGWRPLEDVRVLSDTTRGFLTSGLVSLDLPTGLVNDSPMMPAGLYWVRLSCDASSLAYAGLRRIANGGLRVTRAPEEPLPERALAAGSITLRSQAIPGVASVEQPQPGFGLRRAETDQARSVRIGERVRHKNRASTPWDFERLVLERFPQVDKVRCLPHCAEDHAGPAPGQVMVVVAPAGPRPGEPAAATRALRLDPLELSRIQTFLQERASPAATISVRNAAYELVQARARVELKLGADWGESLAQINEAIGLHLSPWREGGCCPGFDWRVRAEDIEDCLRRLPQVESVSRISLLHVWATAGRRGAGLYSFEDTAAAGSSASEVRAKHPWSLVRPAEQHLIAVATADGDSDPEPTGIAIAGDAEAAGLLLGSTLVVSGVERPAAAHPDDGDDTP